MSPALIQAISRFNHSKKRLPKEHRTVQFYTSEDGHTLVVDLHVGWQCPLKNEWVAFKTDWAIDWINYQDMRGDGQADLDKHIIQFLDQALAETLRKIDEKYKNTLSKPN